VHQWKYNKTTSHLTDQGASARGKGVPRRVLTEAGCAGKENAWLLLMQPLAPASRQTVVLFTFFCFHGRFSAVYLFVFLKFCCLLPS
jgi:hypothetical protein